LSDGVSFTLFVFIFGLIVYLGNAIVGRINTLLMIGLVLSYILVVGLGAPFVEWKNLLRGSWGHTIIAVPLLLTIFSFQTIVPSLTIYLKQDARALRTAIILGTTMALVVYVVWQWLVLGTVLFEGQYGLKAALEEGKPATEFLGICIGSRCIGGFASFFAFFALVTSFLGIALGLFDFLADGLKISRKKMGAVTLGLLVAVPTLFFALTFERVFLTALDTSGGIGDAILNGFMPAMMLWVGRYRRNIHSPYRIPGGKPLIVVVMLYAGVVLAVEILGKFGVIPSLG